MKKMKKGRNLVLLTVMVAAGMFLMACTSEYLVGGWEPYPGIKPQIRSGGPSSGGVDRIGSNCMYNPALDSRPIASTPISTSRITTGAKDLVKKVLFKSERAWNERDMVGYFGLFHPEAKIMVGREQNIVSKADYVKMFPAAFDNAGTVKYESLSVNILDAKTATAEGVASISADKGIIWLTKKLRLVKHGSKWLISESTYDIYFKGDTDPRDRSRPRSGGETPS